MQENEFERRLQEDMSEFRVRPSEVVWEKIEDQLRKRKKRRVIFYVFLLAGLSVAGYTGYFLFTPQKQILTEQGVSKTGKDGKETPESSVTGKDANNTNPVNEIDEQQNQPTNTENVVKAENRIPNNDADQVGLEGRQFHNRSSELIISKQSTKINPEKSKNKIATTGDQRVATPDQKNINPVESVIIPKSETAERNIKPDQQLTAAKKQTNVAADSVIAAIKKQEQDLPADQKKAVKTTRSSIRWGLELSAGVSQLSNKAFSFSGVNQQADALYVNTPGNNTGGNINFYYPPSEILRGIAFKAALVGEMSISKKSSVSAGLGYAYYSNEIRTGSYKDTSFVLRTMADQSVALNSYYQGSQVMEYTNKYHFIQVPINYHLQLNKGVKVPIVWNIGVSPAYLFSTNALVYDTASGGIYYKNKDAFNKFHFNLNTGIAFRIGKTGKLQWSIGPEISMDMTGLTKDVILPNASSTSSSQKRYFIYGGISGRVYFKKKSSK